MRFGNPSKKTKVIASTKGHAVSFPGKGTLKQADAPKEYLVTEDGLVFVPVPTSIQSEVAAQGMLPESEIEEKEERSGPAKPDTREALQQAVFEAFEILVATNDRESFTGVGVPKAPVVEKLLGYAVTNTEIKELWTEFKIAQKDRE